MFHAEFAKFAEASVRHKTHAENAECAEPRVRLRILREGGAASVRDHRAQGGALRLRVLCELRVRIRGQRGRRGSAFSAAPCVIRALRVRVRGRSWRPPSGVPPIADAPSAPFAACCTAVVCKQNAFRRNFRLHSAGPWV